MTDRMAEPLHGTGHGAPVVDLVAPPESETDPADQLAGLLRSPDTGELTAREQAMIVRLEKLKRAKREYEAAAKALAPDVEKLHTALVELAIERGLYAETGHITLPDVSDGQGFELHPHDQIMIWPKYRIDPATDQPYELADLVEALHDTGLDHLIVERPEQYGWPGYLRERVRQWRQSCGEAGVTDAAGHYVDLDGTPLLPDELANPVADVLALPAALRAIVEPVETHTIKFTRREEVSRAVLDLDAAELNALDESEAATESSAANAPRGG